MTIRRGKNTVRPAVTQEDVHEITDTVIEHPVGEEQEIVECHTNRFGRMDEEYLQWIAFMEEEITISIALSDNKFAVDPVPCGVNGQIKRIKRGEPTKIKRKFLDALIQVEFSVRPVQYEDENKLKQTKLVKQPRLAYPVMILDHGSDPVRSQRWFQWRCNEAA